MTCAPDHPGLRRRAARIVALASGGPGRSFVQGMAAPAALPPQEPILSPAAIARLEFGLRDLLSGHSLDEDVALRDPTRFFVHEPQAPVNDHDPNARFAFRGADAVERLDAILALSDIAQVLPLPGIWDAGKLLRAAIRAYVEEREPLDRSLGIVPASGKTARHGAALDRRNALIRHVRQAVPDWRDLSDRQAAAAMITSFDRYAAGGWAVDRRRDTAPAPEPTATWWRLLKLGLPRKKTMPRRTALKDVLRAGGA